jgi:hypothetical protein
MAKQLKEPFSFCEISLHLRFWYVSHLCFQNRFVKHLTELWLVLSSLLRIPSAYNSVTNKSSRVYIVLLDVQSGSLRPVIRHQSPL